MPLILNSLPVSTLEMAEYEAELRVTMKEERLIQLKELNDKTFEKN